MTSKTAGIAAAILTCMSITAIAQPVGVPGPHLLVYKTKKNFKKLVPVLLSEDGKRIVTYPAPQDLAAAGKDAMPVSLKKGYLMDNRGIGTNVAFLNISYRKYAHMKEPLSQEKMMNMIKCKDPLEVLCDCGLRSGYPNPEAAVNKMIEDGTLLQRCKVLKQKSSK